MARPFGLSREATVLALARLPLGCAGVSKLNSVALGSFVKHVGAGLAAPAEEATSTSYRS